MSQTVRLNALLDTADECPKLAYSSNYDSLVASKNSCDPTRFFHINRYDESVPCEQGDRRPFAKPAIRGT